MELTYVQLEDQLNAQRRRAERAENDVDGLRRVIRSMKDEIEYLNKAQPNLCKAWDDTQPIALSDTIPEVRIPLVGEVAVTHECGYSYRVVAVVHSPHGRGYQVRFYNSAPQTRLNPQEELRVFLRYAAENVQ